MKNKKRIMVVEDDAAILQLMNSILSEEGYEVQRFTESVSFKAALETPPYPDLVLLDLRLDGEDGQDLARYLKSKGETVSIPVILISARGDLPEVVKSVQASDFLNKPFEVDELIKVVKKYT